MIINNQGGYLFTDEVVEFLLSEFESLTYDKIIDDMYESNFKINQYKEINDSRSIKKADGVIIRPAYDWFNSITYEGAHLNFTGQIATLYLDLDNYHSELKRQGKLYRTESK